MQRYLAICIVALATVLPGMAAEGEKKAVDQATEQALADWQKAWNDGNAEALVALFHPQAVFQTILKHSPERVKMVFGMWMKGYGKIGAMRAVGQYDDGEACAVRADFAKNKDFPVVFLFRKNGDKQMFDDFFFGQDPSVKADDKVIAGFLKVWQAAWNSGNAEAVLKQLHPMGKIPLGVSVGMISKDEIVQEFASMVKELGKIQSTKLKGYKARTNEYIVEFTYSKPAKLTASLNLQKDAKGVWRVFQMDLDSGDRALANPKSWHRQ